jgi:hypothetical protein
MGYPINMSTSIAVIPKRRGRPGTGGRKELIGVRMPSDELAALDAWIATQPDPKPTRPEALRLAAREKFAKG